VVGSVRPALLFPFPKEKEPKKNRKELRKMAVTGPTDKDNIHVSQTQKFMRFLDVDTDQIIQLEMVDTGNVTSDGIAIFALATAPGAPLAALALTPSEGAKVVAAAGTAEALAAAASLFMSIAIQADPLNTGNIYVGGAGIAAGLGVALSAGEVLTMSGGNYLVDLADVFIDSDVNGEGVTWTLIG
jgi:hypothetical protein